MKKGKMHKSEGYWEVNKKRQGLFISHKEGVFEDKETGKETPYHKVRLTQIYEHEEKKGISMSMQVPYRFVAFDVDMLKNLAELLGAIHQEIYGEPLYGGEIKEMPAKPKTETSEVDELLAELDGYRRK